MLILDLFLIDFQRILDPKQDHFGAQFSKKHGLKIDAKIDDFLGGSEEHNVGGLRPRQGTLLTT